MKAFLVWCSLMAALLGLVLLSSGCAAAKPQPVKAPVHQPVFTPPGQTPPELKHVATGLDVVILIAVIAVGVGAGIFFFAPTVAHTISFAIMGTSAAVEGSALITRVSLWFVPWVAIGLAVVAVGVLIYAAYKNRAKLENEFSGAAPLSSTSSTALPIPVQLTHT